MNRNSKNSRRGQRNASASKSCQDPLDVGQQQYVLPPTNVFNHAPHLNVPNVYYQSPLQYYPNSFPPPQPHPYVHSDVVAENYELKTRVESLENAFRKLGNDSQNVTSTYSLNSPLNQRGLNQPMKSMNPPPTQNLSIVKRGQKPSKTVEFKNSNQYPKNRRKTSSTSLEKNKTEQESSSKSSLISCGGGKMPLMGQQNPKNKDQKSSAKSPGGQGQPKPSKNKKDQESSVKTPVVQRQPKPSKNKKDQESSVKTPVVQRQPNPPPKPLDKSNLSALPKDQPQLVKQMPSQEKKGNEKSDVWNLYVIINADVEITLKLSNFLDERLNHQIEFEVDSITKDKTTGYVRFLLKFKSKDERTKAICSFNASNKKNAIRINCKGVDEDNHLQDKPSTLENKVQNQNDTVQQQHEKKMENVRKEINSLLCSVVKASSSQEAISNRVKALEHKEKELLFQLAEYKNTCNDLEMQLKKLQKDEMEDSVEGEKVVRKLGQEQKFLSKALPLYAIRTKITETVLKNKVTILMGKCGSGKSTQLVQYLMETSLVDDGPIVCTEPSEIQALSMAKYVSSEVNSSLGNLVGFSSEKDIHLNIHTKVLFMSEHEMFLQFLKMNSFNAYSCIIIDEVQEKTVYTDLLLGLLKRELSKIPQLRIVIITDPSRIEISIYGSFFSDSVLIELNTCLFPVQVIWSKHDQEDQEDQAQPFKMSIVKQAAAVHCSEDKGDILVFVASVAEAIKFSTDFKSCWKADDYVCLPLYSGLSYNKLKRIYRPLPLGKRKIIFATSCAEVMYAVPNVGYVIDSGMKKERSLESENKNELPSSVITQDSAKRRKERAGSSFAGKCYRLYSQTDYEGMKTTEPYEMSLAESIKISVLNLIKLGIDPMEFEFPTNVPKERISQAIQTLELTYGLDFRLSGCSSE